ncbi:MAG: arginine--tRNA ligase, partial [bacterium]|nr:arginine--tRNA ligase [bacterium]
MIADDLKKAIGETLKEMGIENRVVDLEHPAELSHGDYSTNVALAYSKELKMKPRELAEKIVEKLEALSPKLEEIEKIEIAGPGFINFHLTKKFFVEEVAGIGEGYGKNKKLSGKKVMVEYTDPNPFKAMHIG